MDAKKVFQPPALTADSDIKAIAKPQRRWNGRQPLQTMPGMGTRLVISGEEHKARRRRLKNAHQKAKRTELAKQGRSATGSLYKFKTADVPRAGVGWGGGVL
ncbi:hypothetical protein LTR56_027297, partial [Elasticomyces elasticus]